MEHLSLGRPHELDMTVYHCMICDKDLRRHKGPDTNWEWHYYTVDTHKRHLKIRCNLCNPEQLEEYKKKKGIK
jgi:DNA-directed RNA polymerase subunit RPC12/RpoP